MRTVRAILFLVAFYFLWDFVFYREWIPRQVDMRAQLEAIGATERKTATHTDTLVVKMTSSGDGPNYVSLSSVDKRLATRGADFKIATAPEEIHLFLPADTSFFASLVVDGNGKSAIQVYRNGQICDQSSALGDRPASVVSCHPF